MKCICKAKCFIKLDGKNRRFNPGEVIEVDECPTHFESLEGEKSSAIDFATAGEEELMAREFDLAKLKEYILKTYDKKAGNIGKKKAVDMLIDCRERAIGINLDKL